MSHPPTSTLPSDSLGPWQSVTLSLRLLLLTIALLPLLLLSSMASAAPPTATTQPIRIALIRSLPWAWQDSAGTAHGIMVDAAQAIFAEAMPGSIIKVSCLPVEQVIYELLTGHVDMGFSQADPLLLKNSVPMLIATPPVAVEVWSLRDNAITTPEQLHNARLVVPNMVYNKMPALAQSQLVKAPANEQLLPMLVAKRVDGVVSSQAQLQYQLSAHHLQADDFVHYQLTTISANLWIPASSPLQEHWAKLQTAAEHIVTPEFIQERVEYYLKEAAN